MSGNPYFGKTDLNSYREAIHEMANGLHVERMNELHMAGSDYGAAKAVEDG